MKSIALAEYFGAICLVQLKEPIAVAEAASETAVQEPEFNRDNELRVAVSDQGFGVKPRSYWPPRPVKAGDGPDAGVSYTNVLVARVHAIKGSDDAVALAYQQGAFLVTTVMPMESIDAVSYIGSKKPEQSRLVTPSS